ncbi:MAG: HAMP domain-containing protein [Anaerolineales bacterium]|nr:HAMP domain-containing protein [Chloroflexota bacterium]MBL6982765.1 HAMP domain-containing protein [Anaerolineales bacterium]
MSIFRNHSQLKPRFSIFRSSLHARVAFGVALPVFISLMGLSVVHYWQDLSVLREQASSYAAQLGDVLNNSISHAMVIKDSEHLMTALSDVNRLDIVQQVQIVGVSGKLLAASGTQSDANSVNQLNIGCWECHQYPAGNRPRSVELQEPLDTLRISTTISNHSECSTCHQETSDHLGVLLIDISLEDVKAHTNQTLIRNLAISISSTLLITMGIYWLMHRIVVKRIEDLRIPIATYAAGNHTARILEREGIDDEISQLGDTFNQMADEIDRNAREIEVRTEVRQKAIIDERERIARELHDGLAQVLGYVGTKVMAIRLNLQKENIQEADRQLSQLEDAARSVSLDVREGILGLKMASQVDTNLVAGLDEYIRQFNNLSNVHAQFNKPPDLLVNLLPEEVLHLLRIVQEALTNARKHANASKISVSLDQEQNVIKLAIMDDGRGFDLMNVLELKNGHFGLTTMQERAEEIGADLEFRSKPSGGTRVLVEFDLLRERS